jgi:hypothetical protein
MAIRKEMVENVVKLCLMIGSHRTNRKLRLTVTSTLKIRRGSRRWDSEDVLKFVAKNAIIYDNMVTFIIHKQIY